MKYLVIIAALALAACKEDAAAIPDPVPLTQDSLAYFCQMNIAEHAGPKGQIHLEGYLQPIFFSQARDLVAYIKSPERDAKVVAIYVSDMGAAPSWAHPGDDNWIDANTATFVVGAPVAGGMGAPELVPFADPQKAQAFIATYGGQTMTLDQIPDETVLGPVDMDLSLEIPKMSHPLTRRRFLSISAAFGLTAGTARAGEVIRWRGHALGAKTSMILTGLDATQAQPIFLAVEQELARMESIFSLYRDDSEITRLNADGRLSAPSPELLDVLSLSSALNRASDGAFDPTVQPVWQAMAQGKDIRQAQGAVGWEGLRFDTRRVTFERPGMGLTLNGIAQGYVTDKIAALLRRRGLENVLIDMGEIAAIGTRPDGRDWQAKISRPDGVIVHHVALRDRALATSAPLGTILPAEGNPGHIIDPRNVSAAAKQALVSVSASQAAVADGLSTTCCLLDRNNAQSVIAKFTGAELEQII